MLTMRKLDILTESAKELGEGLKQIEERLNALEDRRGIRANQDTAQVQDPELSPELITVSREELKQCLEATLEDLMCNGGVLSQLAEKCMNMVKKRALMVAELKNHDV